MLIVDFVFWRDGRPYEDMVIERAGSNLPEITMNKEDAILVKPEEGDYFVAPSEIEKDDLITDTALSRASEDTGYDIIDEIFGLDIEEPFEDEEEAVNLIPELPFAEPEDIDPNVLDEDENEIKIPQSSNIKAKAKIAIVIDDMGMNLNQSRAAINLPSEITLAFLPYAEKVRELSAKAKEQGHELIIHAPMEAMSSTISLGELAFTSDMNYTQFKDEFNKMAASFDSYVGLNNHMGSRLTQKKEHMAYLMEHLKAKGLYFLDSRTIHTSVADDMAKLYGVPSIQRDVFLDHEETKEYTENALENVERIARDTGAAVAIGHPKEITIQALKNWIPTLEAKGFELVKLSELLSDKELQSQN